MQILRPVPHILVSSAYVASVEHGLKLSCLDVSEGVRPTVVSDSSFLLGFAEASIVLTNSSIYGVTTKLDAILAFNNSNVTLSDSHFANNEATNAALQVVNSSHSVVDNCTFFNNTCIHG